MLRRLVVSTARVAVVLAGVVAVSATPTTDHQADDPDNNHTGSSNIITIDIPAANLHSTKPLPRDVYGYSIEPIWLDSYTSTPLASTLLSHITSLTGGVPPPIRIGGTTSDKTYIHPSLPGGNSSVPIPGLPDAELFNITPSWFRTWGDYFHEDTHLTYCLNFADNSSDWDNAVEQSLAASEGLLSLWFNNTASNDDDNTKNKRKRTLLFELGNEIDHFIDKGWRDGSTWGTETYVDQFIQLTGRIVEAHHSSSSFSSSSSSSSSSLPMAPKFQAAVFADPPWFPDQHDEIDDFDIVNLTSLSLGNLPGRVNDWNNGDKEEEEEEEKGKIEISSYSVHMYPQSTCDAERWSRMSLDLLSNHGELRYGGNITQWVDQSSASLNSSSLGEGEKTPTPLIMGETNSVSCGGRSGISDVFGSALWAVDYVLLNAAVVGIPRTYFHLGARSEYSGFTPLGPYEYGYTAYYGQDESDKEKEWLEGGVRAGWYGHYFLGRVLQSLPGGGGEEEWRIAEIPPPPPSPSSSEEDDENNPPPRNWLSGFSIYSSPSSPSSSFPTSSSSHQITLQKLVFLDTGIWNGTSGLSNPSTLSATDGKVFSPGRRPVNRFSVRTIMTTRTTTTTTTSSSSGDVEEEEENRNQNQGQGQGWSPGQSVRVTRLRAPGTNAKSNITVGGLSFDPQTGEAFRAAAAAAVDEEEEEEETLVVGEDGTIEFDMRRAEGVLLERIS